MHSKRRIKFADKLFLSITAVLTMIFMIFGVWMLFSYFQRILNREKEQMQSESRMFLYLYEVNYQAALEYGEEYALKWAAESTAPTLERSGTRCFVMDSGGTLYFGEWAAEEGGFGSLVEGLIGRLSEEPANTAYGIRNLGDRYYLLDICTMEAKEDLIYLGLCRDISTIYEDRRSLLNQYRFAVGGLLLAGGACIYLLSRYMTRPIRQLNRVAAQIAGGNYDKRSSDKSGDEIGDLAKSFNRMADRLVKQMQEKELEAKRQEDFTAAFAHELKTPLTSIIGYADMLNTVEMSEEERREAYYYIFSQGKRLESLSHKLLELVGMERHPLERKKISTRALEENLRATMRPVFQTKEIQGKIVMERAVLMGDFELLLSLLYNLLDNAVKAVEKNGFILLKGRCTGEGYEIKVVDNGRGIPAEEIGRITEAFYMVDKSRSRREGGAGIGMALCRKIILLHGGTLQIQSKLGEGTVMRLFFPKEKLPKENFPLGKLPAGKPSVKHSLGGKEKTG